MTSKTSKNETFWPDTLVDRDRGALGWIPIARTLTANWWRFGLSSESFATLVWLLTWVRKDFTRVRFSQIAIAKQQGIHRTTVFRQMQKLSKEHHLIEFISPTVVSLQPFMNRLAEFEAQRQRERAVESFDENLKAVGLMEHLGGRPRNPEEPSAARFGTPDQSDLHEGDSAWPFRPTLDSEAAADMGSAGAR